jgi:hypothetical protein
MQLRGKPDKGRTGSDVYALSRNEGALRSCGPRPARAARGGWQVTGPWGALKIEACGQRVSSSRGPPAAVRRRNEWECKAPYIPAASC